jgi:hypothetical protein
MVGNPLLFGRSRFGRADVQIPVDLHGISVDDFQGELSGQCQSNFGFPDTGRALDDDYLRLFYARLLILIIIHGTALAGSV